MAGLFSCLSQPESAIAAAVSAGGTYPHCASHTAGTTGFFLYESLSVNCYEILPSWILRSSCVFFLVIKQQKVCIYSLTRAADSTCKTAVAFRFHVHRASRSGWSGYPRVIHAHPSWFDVVTRPFCRRFRKRAGLLALLERLVRACSRALDRNWRVRNLSLLTIVRALLSNSPPFSFLKIWRSWEGSSAGVHQVNSSRCYLSMEGVEISCRMRPAYCER